MGMLSSCHLHIIWEVPVRRGSVYVCRGQMIKLFVASPWKKSSCQSSGEASQPGRKGKVTGLHCPCYQHLVWRLLIIIIYYVGLETVPRTRKQMKMMKSHQHSWEMLGEVPGQQQGTTHSPEAGVTQGKTPKELVSTQEVRSKNQIFLSDYTVVTLARFVLVFHFCVLIKGSLSH